MTAPSRIRDGPPALVVDAAGVLAAWDDPGLVVSDATMIAANVFVATLACP